MTFRTKLLLISSFTVAGAVALVTGAVSVSTRRAFERIDGERRDALLDQFRGELDARGQEVARQVERAAASAAVQQIVAGAAEYDRAQTEAEGGVARFPGRGAAGSDHHFLGALAGAIRIQERLADRARRLELARRISRAHPDAGGKRGRADRDSSGRRRERLVAGGRRLTPEFLKSLGVAPGNARAAVALAG